MVIPRLVGQALRGDPLTVYGDGSQTRCFLHVADAIQAIIGLTECRGALGKVFNVGSTEEISILDLARKILACAGSRQIMDTGGSRGIPGESPQEPIRMVPYDQAYKPGFEDMLRRVPNISRIFRYTQWEPSRSLAEIIQDVTAHFNANGISSQPDHDHAIKA